MHQLYSRQPLIMRLLLAASSGAIGALGQAPYDQPMAMVLSLVLGFTLWRYDPLHSALTGWFFGAGYFALTLFWIVEPFQVDVARHGWMAPFALLFLSFGLALFWALAFGSARRLGVGAFGLVLTWTAAEMMRAYVFTGFPWASPAQVSVNGLASEMLSVWGPHGTTFALLLLACLLSCPAKTKAKRVHWLGQGALLIAAGAALYLPVMRSAAELSPHWVRLIQPNAAQHLKWRPEMADVFFQRQLEMTSAAPMPDASAPDLIVWPETAIPWRLDTAQPALAEIVHASDGVPVALGALRAQGKRLRNTMAVLGPSGEITAQYDKHHLVPFGEYIPFANMVEKIGLRGLAQTMGGFDSGPGPSVLDLGIVGKVLPLICYEAVFAHGVNAVPERADLILQVTNDAWFGQYAGPQQHLAQARMRAIEQGLPLIRAANTGISAVIDPFGRILSELPLNEIGFLDAQIPSPLPPSVYSRTGDYPVILTLLLTFSAAFLRQIRHRFRRND
ncbi:MAG: apolipoprotein N-acyltransferase [Roseobacter sp.]